MSFVRKDVFTGACILISEARGARPLTTGAAYAETPVEICPFCPGNEGMTPLLPPSGEESWQTRFFPNKYPALEYSDISGGEEESASGVHDVFVDTRSHTENLKDFSAAHIEKIIRLLIERYTVYSADKNIKYIQIFKNKGARAGASQSHSHWQLIAGGFVPQMQETLSARLYEYKEQTGGCLYCDVLEREHSGGRILLDNGLFAAFTPYASRFSYETWIVPKRHLPVFSGLAGDEITALAEALASLVRAFEKLVENMDYNVLLMDSPATGSRELFHWHIQLLPKMGVLAGYELSTGSYINHIPPEKAAEQLRQALGGG